MIGAMPVMCVVALSLLIPWMGECQSVTLQIEPEIISRESPTLLGFGIEDVNHELYGGLYSQMVYGEDFEEPAGSTGVSGDTSPPPHGSFPPTWSAIGAPAGADPPAYETITSKVFNGKQAQLLAPGASAPARILNRGLYQQGMYFEAGREYEGYLYARSVGGGLEERQLEVSAAMGSEAESILVLASASFSVRSGSWTRLDFALQPSQAAGCTAVRSMGGCRRTPEGECLRCSGGLLLSARGGPLAVDFVFLQPGSWGRFSGLPVRRDVAGQLQAAGVNVLRLGGSMCNVAGYRWKSMLGPREHRQPYEGLWHPYASQGWRVFEFLELCEALGVQGVVTLNNLETPGDLADLVEYAFGGPETAWGQRRIDEGRHPKPYRPFIVEIGNEQDLNSTLVRQVHDGTVAMRARAAKVGLKPDALRFAIGHNLDKSRINTSTFHDMVNATLFLGDTVMWDLHTDGNEPKEVDNWSDTFHDTLQMLDMLGSKMKLAVFEENAFRHDIVRGLNRARYANTYSRLGGRFAAGTAANGLQVLGLNDNDWDQGAVFMGPDRSWLSPFGHVDALVARASERVVLHTRLRWAAAVAPNRTRLDAAASRSDNGTAFALRVVNWDEKTNATVSVNLPQGVACEQAEVARLWSLPGVVNPPSDVARVAPTRWVVRNHLGNLSMPALSLLTIRWTGCTGGLGDVVTIHM